MAIITISRGSFSKGKEVAEKVAKKLGYEALSREVILEASNDFRISQEKLDHAIHDAPSILERFTFEKQKYIAYVAAEILTHFKNDNVVYHGLAGHFFADRISHLFKVRIIADMEDRIEALMEKEHMTRSQAAEFLKKDDQERKNWSYQLYGVDTADITLYDMVIHIRKLTVDNAVDLICQAVSQPQFKALPDSQQAVEDLALAAKTKAALMNDYPSCEVTAKGNAVEISAFISAYSDNKIADHIKEKALMVPGVHSATINLKPKTLF